MLVLWKCQSQDWEKEKYQMLMNFVVPVSLNWNCYFVCYHDHDACVSSNKGLRGDHADRSVNIVSNMGIVGPGWKTRGIVGPKSSTDGWTYASTGLRVSSRNFFLIMHKSFYFWEEVDSGPTAGLQISNKLLADRLSRDSRTAGVGVVAHW